MYALITCKKRASTSSSSRCHRIATVHLMSKIRRPHADGRHEGGLHGCRAARAPSNLDRLTCKQPGTVAHCLTYLHGGSCHQPKDHLQLHGAGENHTAHTATFPPKDVLQGMPSVEAIPFGDPESQQHARSVLDNAASDFHRDFDA